MVRFDDVNYYMIQILFYFIKEILQLGRILQCIYVAIRTIKYSLPWYV